MGKFSDPVEDARSFSYDRDYKPPQLESESSKEDKFIGERATKSLLGTVDDTLFDGNSVATVDSMKSNNNSPVQQGRPKTSKKFAKKSPPE